MSDLLEDLNAPQRDAVLHDHGPLLVLAGAGSGKTRVIVRRIAYLVRERGVLPWRIFAVTYTNKAAKEMKERLVQLLGPEANELFVSTFHSAAATLLRREADRIGLNRNFVIYDDSDQVTLAKRAMKELGIESGTVTPREVLSRIDQEKNQGRLPDQMKVSQFDIRARLYHRIYTRYQALLRAANAVDFGDLLLLLVNALTEHEDLRNKYRARFQHVLVDEFQDTNPVQYALLKLLAPPAANVVVVGDDDQSIYRWRGAEVDNILGFPREYPLAKVVKLEQNYRSDQTILKAANAVISQNRRRMEKELFSTRAVGEPLELVIARDERGEAQEIARRIHDLKFQGICDYDQVAVFYRTNAQSRVLEETLRLARVPYAVVSGRSFYDRTEIRDAASYLRLMVNPKSDADFLRVVNTPPRGIGDTTVERLTEYAGGAGLSLFEAIEHPARIETLNNAAQKKLAQFRALLDNLVEAGLKSPNATSAASHMLQATGLLRVYQDQGTDEAVTRAENLQELISATTEFDQQTNVLSSAPGEEVQAPPSPLHGFLEQVSLVGESDGEGAAGKVSLMTMHAAKGLEFDAVFIAGMEEEMFPSRRATAPDADEDDMAEERRLCYVGFTRARRRLTLSLAQSRMVFGQLNFHAPSRFLAEVPRALFGFEEQKSTRHEKVTREVGRNADGGREVEIDRSYDQSGDSGDEGDVRGRKVRHPQFGTGVVVEARGRGPDAKVLVRFPDLGVKTVIARFLVPM